MQAWQKLIEWKRAKWMRVGRVNVCKLIEYSGHAVMTMLSLFCLIAVPGAFVQAILLVFILLVICGVMAIRGHLQVALLNVFILSMAIALSPTSDMDMIQRQPTLSLIMLATFTMAFIGVAIGLYRLQHENKETSARP